MKRINKTNAVGNKPRAIHIVVLFTNFIKPLRVKNLIIRILKNTYEENQKIDKA